MKEEAINRIREHYQQIKNVYEWQMSLKKELLELKEDSKVKRYLELLSSIDEETIKAVIFKYTAEEQLINIAYERLPRVFSENMTDSNKIMVYMGSYIIDIATKEPYITYERDPKTSYKSYKDLETTKIYNIDKDKCLKFEEKCLTLYLPISEYSQEEYYQRYINLQNWFKARLLYHSQSDVIEEMKKLYAREYSRLYPAFHSITKVADLPIDEYVTSHPAEGFIENMCLSKEEYMTVKLYIKQLEKKSI